MATPERLIVASFATLGLRRDDATPEEVKAAYKTLATQQHPDKGGDPETFQLLQKAYEVALKEASLLRYRVRDPPARSLQLATVGGLCRAEQPEARAAGLRWSSGESSRRGRSRRSMRR